MLLRLALEAAIGAVKPSDSLLCDATILVYNNLAVPIWGAFANAIIFSSC